MAAVTRTGHRYSDSRDRVTLDVWFPPAQVNPGQPPRSCPALQCGLIVGDVVEVEVADLQQPPASAEDAYLRLHLLSECRMPPNSMNLEGIFSVLHNVAWTSAGPVLPDRVAELRAALAPQHQQVTVFCIDKFPRMVDYVVPEQVRIGDADRVRLGAHLAPGTTVMHEGFVNYNAGSLGAAMIEGRVTPGVVVGRDSDVGAGSSIMGTLSGGGKQVNAIGERSLLGANGGIGISLGDDCVVEAGLYVTAGTKVRTPDGQVVPARQLSGQSGLLFRRNSQSGQVEVISSAGTDWGGLNQDLHKQD